MCDIGQDYLCSLGRNLLLVGMSPPSDADWRIALLRDEDRRELLGLVLLRCVAGQVRDCDKHETESSLRWWQLRRRCILLKTMLAPGLLD